MEPLRCWAMRPADIEKGIPALYCRHLERHGRMCTQFFGPFFLSWSPYECAHDHGPSGRLSVAHRLLELSWRIDLLAFRLGDRSHLAEMLRAMAARLLVSADAAAADLREVLEDVRIGEEVAATQSDGVNPSILEAFESTREILRAAAELLRPFAKEAGR